MTDMEARIITSGTLRIQDLLRAYADELATISKDHSDLVQAALLQAENLDTNPIATEEDFEDAHWLLEDLDEALNENAPDGYYFGTDPDTPDEKGWFPIPQDEYKLAAFYDRYDPLPRTAQAVIFDRLLDLALPVVTYYKTDLFHDAVYIHNVIAKHSDLTSEEGVTFYYGLRETGTDIGVDGELIRRYNKYTYKIRVYNKSDCWFMEVEEVQNEQV